MEKKNKKANPRYQQIAVDIASNIAEKKYRIGERLSGRSTFAGKYAVSPETIRKSISLLSDYEIVDIKQGSGIIIKSYENALRFIQHYEDIQSVNELKKEILASVERQKKEIELLYNTINKLVDKTERFRSINPFIPFEAEISSNTICINKSISDCKFWQNTKATIIAIKRNNKLIKSPGPHEVLLDKDIIYFIGNEECYELVLRFI